MATADIYFGTPGAGGLPISRYLIQWRLPGDPWSSTQQETAARSPHEVSGLADNTDYEFRVQARNTAGDGAWSGAVLVQIPTIPPNLGTVDIYFGAPDDGDSMITDFQIQWRKLDQIWSGARQNNVAGSPHSITNLTLATEYQFRVRAANAIGPGDWSVAISVVIGAPAPVEGSDVEGVDIEGSDVEGPDIPRSPSEGSDVEGSDVEGSDVEGPDIPRSPSEGSDVEGPG